MLKHFKQGAETVIACNLFTTTRIRQTIVCSHPGTLFSLFKNFLQARKVEVDGARRLLSTHCLQNKIPVKLTLKIVESMKSIR